MTISRRLLARVCAAVALASATVAGPALGAGNAVLNDCQATGKLTHPYTVAQLRHALAVMPATTKQYTSCFDVVQSALVSARKHNGKLPVASTTGGGSSFLPTPVIIILVVLILGAVTFGALAIRRRRAGPGEAQDAPGRGTPAERAATRVMPSVPPPGSAGETSRPVPPAGAGETAETRAMPSVPPEERSDEAPTRVDEHEDDPREGERP
jgi:hypothetical protein